MGISRQFTSEKAYLFYWNAKKSSGYVEHFMFSGTAYTGTNGRCQYQIRGNAQNDIIGFTNPLYLAETKSLTAKIVCQAGDCGIGQLLLYDLSNPTTPTQYGSNFDCYAGSTNYNYVVSLDLGSVPAGYYLIGVKQYDKNASATVYRLYLSEVIIYETP